jgi:putative transposase
VLKHVLNHLKQLLTLDFQWLLQRFACWAQPLHTPLLLATAADVFRSKPQLVAENALLRQQLMILRRQIKRPVYGKTDRLLLVLLASMVRAWKQALFLVQPETVLRWHRGLFEVGLSS